MPASDLRLWKRARSWLYWLHRWTGIALCVLFVIWFVSGVVMMYVPFPSFRAEERVATGQPLAWRDVRIGPDVALSTLAARSFPDEMRLEMAGGEPVYRMTFDGERRAVSAATGATIGPVDAQEAARIARVFSGSAATSVALIDRDQWVVTRAFARIAPFWRVRLEDGRGTDIYVTRSTGEIVQNTDRRERFWNWLGAVPHWIYFEALRIHQEPWRQTVMWASGIGVVGAILGMWIGILRIRVGRRYKSGAMSPYRGWMKWHHWGGLIGGVFLVTWVFSGWVSMSPFGGFGSGDAKEIERRWAGRKNPRFAATDLSRLASVAKDAVELRFEFVGGRPFILVAQRDGSTALDGVSARPFSPRRQAIEAQAAQAVPAGRLIGTTLLTHHDLYWYADGPHSDGGRLPVLRLKFDDPEQSWLYVDPATGRLLSQSSTGRRTYRWLFGALHSFDLPALLAFRPARDVLMILLSAAGLTVSLSGVVVGWRHLVRLSRRRRTLH